LSCLDGSRHAEVVVDGGGFLVEGRGRHM
jgi:hypothetical protein